jgi:ribulose-5-phosphate 4-epimerase/fuculose-1-phosphate aldolase
MSSTEAEVRRDLAAAYNLIAHYGMDDLIHTHLSARLPGEPDKLLINRYGDLFEEITSDTLAVIDHEGRLARGEQVPLNTAGIVIHTAVHKARADAACVIHTHTEAGISIASLHEGLLPLNQTALWFHGNLAYHDYEGIAFDWEEQDRLVADLGKSRAMILRNHGLLTVGRTVGEAFSLMYQLEKSCRIQLAVMASGGKMALPSPAVQDRTAAQYEADPDEAADLEWRALLRLADRINGSRS